MTIGLPLRLLLAGCVALPAWAMADQAVPDLRNEAAIAAGQQRFNATCTGYCHGENGKVGRAPSLRGRDDLSPEQIYATIANGKRQSGKIMPAWKTMLNDQQIWQLTAFIMSLRDAK